MSSSSSFTLSPHNIYAHRLNNSAALCIEIGHYERAISSLQRALKLCERQVSESLSSNGDAVAACCQYSECTLDGCIAFSETNSLFFTSNSNSSSIQLASCNPPIPVATHASTSDAPTNSPRCTKRRRIQETANNSNSTSSTVSSSITTITSQSYIYKTPIRVQRKGHEMGSMFYMIVLFNLALACQLKAIACLRSQQQQLSSNTKYIMAAKTAAREARLLYELILNYWSRIEQQEPRYKTSSDYYYSSIRFRMILSNNLSQLYRLTKDTTQERECLEDLLSTILVVQTRITTQSSTTDDNKNTNCHGDHLDGFLSNTATLTMRDHSAGVA
uniref:Uncharacterized protein n=1 Tax=Pseudo-nitzschia australis TaxID=44445 RepID=A0A7S4AX83_9STRA